MEFRMFDKQVTPPQRRMRKAVDEQSNQGNSVETRCRYCGRESSADMPEPRKRERGEQYQVVVACAECGNDFASISRN
jgi:DNA-directed RNA polymerase subunit M/transcription elongation factor TFIIS